MREVFIGFRLTACGLPCFLRKSNLQKNNDSPLPRRCLRAKRRPQAILHANMKTIRIRLGALALVLGILPLFLPRRPRVARRILIHADRSHVFPLVNDLRNWPRWTAWNQRQEIEYHYDGPPAGAGATQHWRSPGHSGVLHLTQSHEGERIAYTLMMDERMLLEGAVSLEETAPRQTRVLWVVRWQGAAWPWARYMDLMMMGWIGRDFSASLYSLRNLAETTAPVPKPVN